MYRHFAVATLALTALIGFFADTENREAVASELDKRDQQAALREQQKKKEGPRRSFENRATAGPGMSDDTGGGWGEPTDKGSGRGSSTALPLRGLTQACGRDAADPNALVQMSKPQREAYLAKLDEMDCAAIAARAEPVRPTQEQISALAAASAARSGASSID